MALHFGTYYWSKKNVQRCQNTVQGYKMTFDTPFLATCIGVALSSKILLSEILSHLTLVTLVNFYKAVLSEINLHVDTSNQRELF